MHDEGGGHGLRGCRARWWEENIRGAGKWGVMEGASGQGGSKQKVSPMNRPIGASLD